MKKLIVEQKWKRYLAARSRSQSRANARVKDRRREYAAQSYGHPRPKHFKKDSRLVGPEVFSLIQNPEPMIKFFQELRSVTRRRNAFVDLSHVKVMSPEAIAALVAMIGKCSSTGARVSGNTPADDDVKRMLNDSGFRRHVRSAPGSHDLVSAAQVKGQIARRRRTGETNEDRFTQGLARDLVEFGMSKLTGNNRPHGPSFSILCEAMLNTLNHAAGMKVSREPWWASVYYDSERGRACFTFIDQGVGIFESHQLTTALKVLAAFRLMNRGQILEHLLHGKIPSTTREPGRGNGIPGMYDHCKAGRIKNLTVISNNAIGNAESETYDVLSGKFPGTLLYWEIER